MNLVELRRADMQPEDVLLVIGAGRFVMSGTPLPKASSARILMEADPELRDALSIDSGELIEASLALADDSRDLRRFTLSWLNSLNPPSTELYRLFPGLREIESLPIAKISPAALVDRLHEHTGNVHVLADAAGEDDALLDLVERLITTGRFGSIELIASDQALYEGGSPAADIVCELAKFGLQLDLADDARGAGVRRVLAAPGSALAEVGTLEEALASERQAKTEALAELKAAETRAKRAEMQLKSAKTRSKSAHAQLKDAVSRAERADTDLAAARAELQENSKDEAELVELREALKLAREELEDAKAAAHRLTSDAEGVETQLKQAVSRAERADADLAAARTELQESSKDQAELIELREALKLAHEELEDAKAALQDQASEAEARNERETKAARSESEGLRGHIKQLNAELASTRQDLRTAVRLQTLAQTDLSSLREKHREVVQLKDRQDDLLDRLAVRLSEASAYFSAVQGDAAINGVLPDAEVAPHPENTNGASPGRGGKSASKTKAKKAGKKRSKKAEKKGA